MEQNGQVLRRPTPFQLFVRELKQQKTYMAGTVIALVCLVVSNRLVGLKNERKALESEHEEMMANLREDNRKLREKLGDVSDRVMEQVNKQQTSRKVDPLPTRIDAIFDDLKLKHVPAVATQATAAPAAAAAADTPSRGKKPSGEFFV